MQGVLSQSASDPAAQGAGHLGKYVQRGLALLELSEDAGARTAHLCTAELRQPVDCRTDLRKSRAGYRFQVVAAPSRTAVGWAYRRGVAVQFGGGKYGCGGYLHRGFENDKPGSWQDHSLQSLADAFGEGVTPKDKDRHIGAQRQANRPQALA